MALEPWLPDPNFTHVIDGSWSKDGSHRSTFALYGQPFSPVKRHAWFGCSLPMSGKDLSEAMGVNVADGSDLAALMDQLAEVYKAVKAGSEEFRDLVNTNMTDFAGNIRHYAKKAGQTRDASYYALLLGELTAYNQAKAKHPPDTKAMDSAKETIKEACTSLLPASHKLQTASAQLRTQLDEFQSSTYGHWASLNALLEDFRRQLDKSDVRYLENVIKPLQEASLQQRSEFENDAVAAGRDQAWAVLSLYGTVPLASVRALGPRMAAIRAVVEATDNETRFEDHGMRVALRISTCVQQLVIETKAVTASLEQLDDVFRGLEAAWKRIHAEIQGLHDSAAKGDVPKASYNEKAVHQVVDAWNQLSHLVETFEKQAFKEGEYMSLENWLNKTV